MNRDFNSGISVFCREREYNDLNNKSYLRMAPPKVISYSWISRKTQAF